MPNRTTDYYRSLVKELSKLPSEIEWIEFKVNNANPQEIAEYISALSNSAALWDQPKAYLVWGVDNDTHKVIGSSFEYRKARKGNEELEAWLTRMINPKIDFRFHEVTMDDDARVTLLEIPCAASETTKFGSVAHIRIGSNKKPLSGHKDKEAELWRKFDNIAPELRIAADGVSEDELFEFLDYPGYYRILGLPIPSHRTKVLDDFENERFIKKTDAGTWDITSLGALMVAVDLSRFSSLARKAVRVIRYKDNSRIDGILEKAFVKGYALSYEDIAQYIMTIVPQEEVLDGAVRHHEYSFPEIAVRELLANMMAHQSLEQRGTNPMVEVFSDRIEFSNPGAPLIPIERIVDTVPLSRNECMAGFMRKCGICEERGSGYDKIITATSQNRLIAPRVEDQGGQFTKAVLFSKIPFDRIGKEDKVRTCYMLACLANVNFKAIANNDVRQAFGMSEGERAKAGRIIKDTMESELIKPLDPDTAPRYMKYVPFWA